MPSVPSEFTTTCDVCGVVATSPEQVPLGWSMVAGPLQRAPNSPMSARPSFLCPAHTAAYEKFWTPRQPGVTIEVA